MSHKRLRLFDADEDIDPLAGVANFFDLGLVFALAFLLAMVARVGLPELMEGQDNQDPGKSKTVRVKGQQLKDYRVSDQQIGGEGEKLGVAYKLKSGEIIYVPEGAGKGR